MDNGKQILLRQNQRGNIDKLLAQRLLYSQGKDLQYLLIIITVVVPVIISFVTNFTDFNLKESMWIYVMYFFSALLIEKIIEIVIKRKKKTAASIQEKFDIDVYKIDENQTLNTVFVDEDVVRKFSKRDQKNSKKVEKVENWYSVEIERINTNLAILFCQRMNITYDQNIKKKYNLFLLIVAATTFCILFYVSLYMNFSLEKFIVQVLLPSIPIFNFAYKEIRINLESVDNLQKLRQIIETKLNKVKLADNINPKDLREIQDRIYLNRILSPLIPDFIYKVMWTKLEDRMNYSVEKRIENLR
ncbi:hypothetical protein FNJ88_14135 (plasmid) [Chryseobacterium sp. SNU WT5]|uniref:S-4TM family putative pore-forming effector n=1 Tax=Chryseobacterium sp. SNU WT5 TaxID=2594269 RepID=UPI00117CAD04|nr:S-4TM family putative pore-forming effector [Chryseobacterium sp. SNU WT5]QDP86740.1 hypothetical protein FNJ88_14135 [Chryseobacterium sp. SNU WT5]